MIVTTPEFGALDVPEIEVASMRLELSDAAVVEAITRHWPGGVVGFLRDGLLSDAEIAAMRIQPLAGASC